MTSLKLPLDKDVSSFRTKKEIVVTSLPVDRDESGLLHSYTTQSHPEDNTAGRTHFSLSDPSPSDDPECHGKVKVKVEESGEEVDERSAGQSSLFVEDFHSSQRSNCRSDHHLTLQKIAI